MDERAPHRPSIHEERLESLDNLARLLDARWRIPGVGWRFGVDGVASLFPGVGDAAAGLVSAYIIFHGARLGAPNHVLARMAGNVLVDTVVGSVPVLGTIFDVAFKSNLRNARLLRRHFEAEAEKAAASKRDYGQPPPAS